MNKIKLNSVYGAKLERNSEIAYKVMRNSVYRAKK